MAVSLEKVSVGMSGLRANAKPEDIPGGLVEGGIRQSSLPRAG
jgi:hypothetical protein